MRNASLLKSAVWGETALIAIVVAAYLRSVIPGYFALRAALSLIILLRWTSSLLRDSKQEPHILRLFSEETS